MDFILPTFIEPKDIAIAMFGLIKTHYSLNLKHNMYVVQENSGLVRSGFSIEFYIKYIDYFEVVK